MIFKSELRSKCKILPWPTVNFCCGQKQARRYLQTECCSGRVTGMCLHYHREWDVSMTVNK